MKSASFFTNFFIAICVTFTVTDSFAISQKNISKMNHAIIFDYYMNMEIIERNNNLSTLVNYIPNVNNKIKGIKEESNEGGAVEVTTYTFNDNGTLGQFIYQNNDKVYRYNFDYEGERLKSVSIADKKRIFIEYDNLGRVSLIRREGGFDVAYEFNVNYIDKDRQANIKVTHISDGNRRTSNRIYYVVCNKDFRMKSFRYDSYEGSDFVYSKKGDLVSFFFTNVDKKNNRAEWVYSYDNKGNWIEKKLSGSLHKRTIEYK